ncbi:MAG: cytochrome c biogenesis protein CcdA [Candidatus Marinimicrobia bacterium]|nr:cytochrome c biogenesis protein CcdA [Candidatus Neomarinimicrobiota bacterium]MCF7904451.1 cytochrome c biogenesis protein CcdA [Candidatus Neomarinimicrobiota bacterium]
MTDLFEVLTQAVSGSFGIAILASFSWGILSIVLSPCHLTSIPLVIGYISRQNKGSSKQSALLALVFAVGILVSIILIGFITAAMGRLLGDVGAWGPWLAAGLLIVFGLYMMDLVSLNWLNMKLPQIDRAGFTGAALLGLIFGVGLGPCTFAFLAPVLAVILSLNDTSFIKPFGLIMAFGLGHSLVFVLGGVLADVFKRYVNWSGETKTPVYIKRALGTLILLGGVYFGYTAI